MPTTFHLLGVEDASVFERVAPGVFDNPVDPALAAEFLRDPRHHMAVVVEDGMLVAMASAVHYIHPDKAAQMWVNEVGTAPTHRRRGLATRLLGMLEAHAREIGCTTIWLATEADNDPARACYRKLGWKEASGAWYEKKLTEP